MKTQYLISWQFLILKKTLFSGKNFSNKNGINSGFG